MKINFSSQNFFNYRFKQPHNNCGYTPDRAGSDCFVPTFGQTAPTEMLKLEKELRTIVESDDYTEFALFMNDKLNKKTKNLRHRAPTIADEVVQMYLTELLEAWNQKEKEEVINLALKFYNNPKAKSENYITGYAALSLDETYENGEGKWNNLPEEKIKKPLSLPSIEEIEKDKSELLKIIEEAGLTKKQVDLLIENKINNKSTYKIAQEKGVAEPLIQRTIAGAIILIQYKNGIIPQNIKDFVKHYANDGLTLEDFVKKILIVYPHLISTPSSEIITQVTSLTNKFKQEGITEKQLLKTALKLPSIFYQSPDTIYNHTQLYALVEKLKFKNKNIEVDDKVITTNIIDKKILSISNKTLAALTLKWLIKFETRTSIYTTNRITQKVENYFRLHPDKKFASKLVDKYITQGGFADHPAAKFVYEYVDEIQEKILT